MILSFKTNINNKPTYFIKKIWVGFIGALFGMPEVFELWEKYNVRYFEKFNKRWDDPMFDVAPKVHTIRVDEKNRWKAGMKIHMFVFNRSKNMFRFAPVVTCKGIQPIEIVYGDHCIDVIIDNTIYDSVYMHDDTEHPKLIKLALNDGFNNVDEFFEYFNKDFKGKIIHWTNLKY